MEVNYGLNDTLKNLWMDNNGQSIRDKIANNIFINLSKENYQWNDLNTNHGKLNS